MKKSKIIVPAVALLTLGLAASVTGTVAWYTADANAKVNVTTATGSLTSTASSIDAGTYTVNFTVTPADSELELSHVATAAGTDGAGATVAVGDLIYGIVNNGTVNTRKCATSSNFISAYTITAAWAVAPSDPADVAYLAGKHFTINLSVTGQAQLLASNGVTGLVNASTATATVTISANAQTLTVSNYSHGYVHIEPANLEGSESGTTGAVVVDAGSNVSLAS